jgi:uncharacterized membrane protein (DUF2068 family)
MRREEITCPKCKRKIFSAGCFCEVCGQIFKIPLTIKLASVLEIIKGLSQIGVGISSVFARLILNKNIFAPHTLNEVYIRQYAFIIGSVLLIWGILDLIVGIELRKLKIWAAHLGIVSALSGIVSYLLPFRNIFLSSAYVIIVILLLIGWKSFKKIF